MKILNTWTFTGELVPYFYSQLSQRHSCQIVSTYDLEDTDVYIIINISGLGTAGPMPKIKRYITYQLEPISEHLNNEYYLEFLRNAIHNWDYSRVNVKLLNQRLINNISYLPIGFHESIYSLVPNAPKSIDVLFLGFCDPWPRRLELKKNLDSLNQDQEFLKSINRSSLNINFTHGLTLEQMRPVINSSHICINVHIKNDVILETIRLNILIGNKACILSEKSIDKEIDKEYQDGGVLFCEYSEFVSEVKKLLQDPLYCQRVAEKSFEWYSTKRLFSIPDISDLVDW